ncbi:MAG: tetratricopeptide repeat protein [Candidatus Limisoma sp.]
MGIFDIFKKSPSVVWRDRNGEINCPGDACPKECDDSCPIWCQTMGIMMMKVGHNEEAVDDFKKALVIEPNFKEAWVNLAASYGGMNNHIEANKAYKKAYSIDKNYKNAIFGLIISCKHLGQFDEALKYCDEYERKVSRAEAASLRKQVIEARECHG